MAHAASHGSRSFDPGRDGRNRAAADALIGGRNRLPNLCLAGGVALNCVANGKVLRDGRFKNMWVQPAAGDAGGALGAALAVHHDMLGEPRKLNGHIDGDAWLRISGPRIRKWRSSGG